MGKEFSVSIFGLSINISGGHEAENKYESWIERVNILEDVILTKIDQSRYFIVFDDLDEDYRNIIEQSQYEQYTALITSLFKAVQDVKSIFRDRSRYQIHQIIFLRDDIYEIIQDSDKNKWNDFKLELNWDSDKIKQLVAFRITRALASKATATLRFDAAWEKLMGRDQIRAGTRGKKRLGSFDFIARSTYLRPRDFVKYLQACAHEAVQGDRIITSGIIRKVDKAFSNYLKDELIELFAILPDIAVIFDVISQLRKWNFSISDFTRLYEEQVKRGNLVAQRDAGFVLQILFLFSVIGNTPRTGLYFFAT